MPDVKEGVTAPDPVSQTVDDSLALSTLDGPVAPPVPAPTEMDRAPRCLTRIQALAPSMEDTDNGLALGRIATHTLEQVHEADS